MCDSLFPPFVCFLIHMYYTQITLGVSMKRALVTPTTMESVRDGTSSNQVSIIELVTCKTNKRFELSLFTSTITQLNKVLEKVLFS